MADGEAYPAACIKTKVTAPPTMPVKQAEELTGDEANSTHISCIVYWIIALMDWGGGI